jgi:hypothetical protein
MTDETTGRDRERVQVPIRMPRALASGLAEAAKRFNQSRAEVVCALLHEFLRSGRQAQRKALVAWLTRDLPADEPASRKKRGRHAT